MSAAVSYGSNVGHWYKIENASAVLPSLRVDFGPGDDSSMRYAGVLIKVTTVQWPTVNYSQ